MTITKSVLLRSAAAATLAVSFDGQVASAQPETTPVETVVVTASKFGAVNLQNIASNISAITDQQLSANNAVNFDDVVKLVPGIADVSTVPGNHRIAIRGLDSPAGNALVGVYLDETLVSDGGGQGSFNQTDFSLYDMDRIEILRGPQGTEYGAGSEGGTVRYITRKPDPSAFEAFLDGTGSYYSRGNGLGYAFNGMINVPITDTFAVRAVAYARHQDGFVDLPALGLRNTNELSTYGGRLSAQWTPATGTSVLASVLYEKTDMPDNSQVIPGADIRPALFIPWSGVTVSTALNPFRNATYTYNMTVHQSVGIGELVATYSDFHRSTFKAQDQSGFQLNPPYGHNAFLNTLFFANDPMEITSLNRPDTKTAEARFASNLSGPFQVLIGGFYSRAKFFQENVGLLVDPATGKPFSSAANPTPAFTVPDFNDSTALEIQTNKAVFVDTKYKITPAWTLEAGVRFFWVDTDGWTDLIHDPLLHRHLGFTYPPHAHSQSNVKKFELTYNPRDGLLAYVLYSEGFRAGGSNQIGLTSSTIPTTYSPDYVTNYEAGLKISTLEDQLILDGSLYYMTWNGIQIFELDATHTLNGLVNAGDAKAYGLEFEGTAAPKALPGWTAHFNLRYSNQYISKLPLPPNVPTDPEAIGDKIPNSNMWGSFLSVEKSFPLGVNVAHVAGNVSFTGSGHTDFSPLSGNTYQLLPSYALVGLNAGVDGEKWSASFFVRNIFNVREPINWRTNSFDPQNTVFTTPSRTIGLELSYRP